MPGFYGVKLQEVRKKCEGYGMKINLIKIKMTLHDSENLKVIAKEGKIKHIQKYGCLGSNVVDRLEKNYHWSRDKKWHD